MENLNLISIQGKFAPTFWLKNLFEPELFNIVQSLSLKPAIVISSPARTDIIYQNHQDLSQPVLKMWCHFTGKIYQDQISNYFHIKNGTLNVLDYYFSSLDCLSRRERDFQLYQSCFRSHYQMMPAHPILTILVECDQHLHQKKSILPIKGIGINRKPLNKKINPSLLKTLGVIDKTNYN
ncbi:MAG: hypothetical protein ACNS62_23555 [Candidatus Cyclobacteriaceae bacterium M3_2C_046]